MGNSLSSLLHYVPHRARKVSACVVPSETREKKNTAAAEIMSSGMSHINLGTLGLVQTGFFYSFFFFRSFRDAKQAKWTTKKNLSRNSYLFLRPNTILRIFLNHITTATRRYSFDSLFFVFSSFQISQSVGYQQRFSPRSHVCLRCKIPN